jgi:predicted AAA+ superfamily ATPase
MTNYRPRLVDPQVDAALRAVGAVVIQGPKACGKTRTAEQHAASAAYLGQDPPLRAAAQADPRGVLDGAAPRLIDEWQVAPQVWNAVRGEVDRRTLRGQFILTGSATPADDATRHSGAGRFIRIPMAPMALAESGDSDASISLAGVLAGEAVSSATGAGDVRHVIDLACRGGWPANIGLDPASAIAVNRGYLDSIAGADIVTVDGVRRDPRRVRDLLRALGRNTATYVTKTRLRAEASEIGTGALDPKTLNSYLDALMRLWVISYQEAWGQSLRSSAQITGSPKLHLADPSLAVAAIRTAGPESLWREPKTFGFIFETLVHRDLAAYCQVLGADVFAYRETGAPQREIDAVVVRDGQWAGFEVKVDARAETLDAAAAGLLSLAGKFTTAPPPAALGIITATGPSYRRPDGVCVINIQHLGT